MFGVIIHIFSETHVAHPKPSDAVAVIMIEIFYVIIIPLDEETLYILRHAAILINRIALLYSRMSFTDESTTHCCNQRKKQGEKIGFPVGKI